MAEHSSSYLTANSLPRSASNSSIATTATIDSSISHADSYLSSASSQKRRGLLGKLESGLRSVTRRLSRSHTTLSEMEVQILSTITSFTREEICQWHEKFLADCPDGYMTRKQFISMYKSLCPKYDAERFARHVFRAFDRDRSKKVDFHEFLIGLSMTSTTSPPEKKLEWTFHVFDIDGDGLLTRRECLEVIESIVRFNFLSQTHLLNPNLEQILNSAKRSMMKIFDSVRDNPTDKLNMQQFVEGCLKDQFVAQLLAPSASPSLTNTTDLPATD